MSTQTPRSVTARPDLLKRIEPLAGVLPAFDYTPRESGEVDFYGASDVLARSLGLPRAPFTRPGPTWLHGWSGIWRSSVANKPEVFSDRLRKDRPCLVDNLRAENLLKSAGYGLARAIGAPLTYADAGPVERIPGSLLIMPVHSSRFATFDGRDKRLPYVEECLPLRERFPLVAGCIGAEDVMMENWLHAFEVNDLPWVCGAWIFDRNALVRMQRILRSFEYVCTNERGSHVAYAAYCGCKVFFYGENRERPVDVQLMHPFFRDNPALREEVRQTDREEARLFRADFPFLHVPPEQAATHVEWAREQLGEARKLPPAEVASLLGWKLKRRGPRHEIANPVDLVGGGELIDQANAHFKARNHAAALRALDAVVDRGARARGVQLMRGLCLRSLGRDAEARQALETELAAYPDSKEAGAALAALSLAPASNPAASTAAAAPAPMHPMKAPSPSAPSAAAQLALSGALEPGKGAPHAFLNPPLEPNNADLYVVRGTILRAVKAALPHFHGTFLDIGCGVMPYRGLITAAPSRVSKYLGLDLEGSEIYHAEVDLRWDGRRIPLPDASVDSAMATEVLEHCPEPLVVLREARRVLKPGGVFFFTVPFIWPLHDAPYDFFRYTPFALEKLLAEAGFENFQVRAMSGWNASLAQVMGLWLKRSPMSPEARNQMARQLWPLYQQLVKTDELPADSHAGNTLSTGWTGLAYAPAARAATTDGKHALPAEVPASTPAAAPVPAPEPAATAISAPASAPSPAPEVEPAELPVVLVRSHEFNYSETFLEDHVAHLSQNLTLLYGWPFPRFLRGGKTVLTPGTESAIARALAAGGKITPDLWKAYGRDLADWLRGCGARAAILESGLMGSFLHEACEAAKLPYVVHFHGVDAFGRELLERWLPHYKKFFATAHRVVAVSRAMCAQLEALGAPAGKVLLAPYGVAVNLQTLARPGEAPPAFVAVGRFVEKKAPLNTLQAFARVHREVPAARLTMIGDGPLLESCQRWARENGVADAVTFSGVRSRAEVSAAMAAARVFVQHSVTAANGDSEGLPLAVLEAGAHGLPVVSTRHAGIPDAVHDGEHGYLVKEHDIVGMAEAMLRLARDPALAARLGAAFRARVLAEYSRKVSIERLQRLLAAAAGSASSAPSSAVPSSAVLPSAALSSVVPSSVVQPASAQPVADRLASEKAAAHAAIAAARAAGDVEAEAGALQQLLGLDRAETAAYERLGNLLHGAGDEAGAYLCYREGRRLGGLGEAATARLVALEAGEAARSEFARTYREQIGETEPGRAAQPQRILVVTNLFPPQELGGYGRTMWEFCDLLVKRGHEVKVLTADCPEWARACDPGMDRLEPRVERSLRLFGTWEKGAAKPLADRAEIHRVADQNTRRILDAVRSFRPTRVLAGNLDFVGYAFIEQCLARKLPVLHRLGNGETSYPVDSVLENPLFCLAGNTEWLNRRLQEKGYRAGRWSVVYPGSPLEHYYRAFPPRFDRLRIAYASIFAPFKGPHTLFEALGHLARAGVDFTLECAGEQPDASFRNECARLAQRAGFADRVRWHGFINRAGLAAMFSRCNTLVFPSVFEEPFGKTQIEAMAAGLAVVSSGTGGTPEIVKPEVNGLIFKTRDAADLARQLQSLPRDPERWARLASQGQADAYRFTTAESVRRIEAFFDGPFRGEVPKSAALVAESAAAR